MIFHTRTILMSIVATLLNLEDIYGFGLIPGKKSICTPLSAVTNEGLSNGHSSSSNYHDAEKDDEQIKHQYLGETVGYTGRIGSYLSRCGNSKFVGVARNETPGILTESGPIFVSVPANEVPFGE